MASDERSRLRPAAGGASARIGVVDLGSNSVRLVVYDHLGRVPLPLFNERALCGLGRDLAATGRLAPEGVDKAMASLRRFVAIARAMGVDELTVLATAATRDAADGAGFLEDVERRCGVPVRQLSGAEEAHLSALGVVSAIPGADGAMGDLGGGSLELVALDDGRPSHHTTLPFGSLRLDGDKADDVARELKQLPWLDAVRGRNFYPVGGTWRTLARVHMAEVGHPVHVIHHYEMAGDEAAEFCRLVAGLEPGSLTRLGGIPQRRLEVLPAAARVLQSVLARARPRRLVFSAFGLREGFVYDRLDQPTRQVDPLIAGCAALGAREGRFGAAVTAYDWISPLFPGDGPAQSRLRLAACHLADLAWSEHPDYRAEHAFLRTLRMQAVGLDHGERAVLALALLVRYGGRQDGAEWRAVRGIVAPERRRWSRTLGTALRLALTLAGGAAELLVEAGLAMDERSVTLTLSGAARDLDDDLVRRRLAAVAQNFDRRPRIVTTG